MALTIDNPEVERLVREWAEKTGTSVGEAVERLVREQLSREPAHDPEREKVRQRLLRERRPDPERVRAAIRDFQEQTARLPVLDLRPPNELLGYDEFGLPQ